MKITIALSVTLLLLLCIQHILSCQSTNCCHTSSCCCTTTCINNCKNDCCCDRNCSPSTPSTLINPPPEERTSSSSNQNNNTAAFTASINLNNTINNENRIYVPINISHHTHNNIIITSSGGKLITDKIPTDCPTTPCPENKAEIVTVKVPVPIPVPGRKEIIPVPIYYPVTYPVPVPQPYPIPGCCVVVTPCVTDYCVPYNRMCGQSCSHSYMYRPVNPCGNGCYKRQYSTTRSCHRSGYCQNYPIDCSYCNENFYLSYEGYHQCGSCYYA